MPRFNVTTSPKWTGSIHIPHIDCNQPLQAECDHFIECIEQGVRPLSDGYSGLRVLSALEAATTSMKNHGERIAIEMHSGEDDETSTGATAPVNGREPTVFSPLRLQ